MVNSEEINKIYSKILELIESEIQENKSLLEFKNHFLTRKDDFYNIQSESLKEELREFIRSSNRYIDEFVIPHDNYLQIRKLISNLYDLLNKNELG